MATDPATIYRQIQSKARATALAALGFTLAASRVVLTPLFVQEGLTTPFIQIIVPGEASIPHSGSSVGLVYEEFEVAHIMQIMRDRFGTYTDAIGSAMTGLIELVTAIRGDGDTDGSATGLHNHVPAGAEGPITLLGWGAIRQMDEDPNFLALIDRYRIIYELDNYQT